MFQLIGDEHKKSLAGIIEKADSADALTTAGALENLIEQIRADIPEKKRVSYGRYSIIKELGLIVFPMLKNAGIDPFDFAFQLFEYKDIAWTIRSLAVQLISISAVEEARLAEALRVFEEAAADEDWVVRECSAGFVRKLIKKQPDAMKEWYLKLTASDNPLVRRFASESIRPVADNTWFKKRPEFCFAVLEKLFFESDPYPRTSVGNNLSDWMRVNEKITWPIVKMLAKNEDKNSYWIAYRACRNLVKKEPERVMDLLGVDEYRYKDRKFFRNRSKIDSTQT